MNGVQEHHIVQYEEELHHKAQQIKARLRPHVKLTVMRGAKRAYDGLGHVTATEVSGRHIPIVFNDIEHFRRAIETRRFYIALPIDASDMDKVMADRSSDYAEASVREMERVFDRVTVDAMFADVKTGENFGTTVTFADDGGLTVDATAGLVYESFLEINQNFIDNDVGTEMEIEKVMGVSGAEVTDMMGETQLTSGDYSRQFVVDKGVITMAVGNAMIPYAANAVDPVLNTSGGVRDCFAMESKRAMCVGIASRFVNIEDESEAKSIGLKIEERKDLLETTQIVVTTEIGSVRTEGSRIQKVQTTV